MFNVDGGYEAVGKWPRSRLLRYRRYLKWMRDRELRMMGIDPDKKDDEDDGTPRWGVERLDEHGHVGWDEERFEERR